MLVPLRAVEVIGLQPPFVVQAPLPSIAQIPITLAWTIIAQPWAVTFRNLPEGLHLFQKHFRLCGRSEPHAFLNLFGVQPFVSKEEFQHSQNFIGPVCCLTFIGFFLFAAKSLYFRRRLLKQRFKFRILRLKLSKLVFVHRLQVCYLRLKGRYLRFKLGNRLSTLQRLRTLQPSHKPALEVAEGGLLPFVESIKSNGDLAR